MHPYGQTSAGSPLGSLLKLPIVSALAAGTRALLQACLSLIPASQQEQGPEASERLDRELRNRYDLDCGDEFSNVSLPTHWGCFTSACRTARALGRPLVVYIHSAAHPDTAAFVRHVLGNPAVCETIRGGFVFWAASVQDAEGFSFAVKMGISTFPSLAAFHTAGETAVAALKVEGAVDAGQLCQLLDEARETIETSLRSQADDRAAAAERNQLRAEQHQELLEAERLDREAALERQRRDDEAALQRSLEEQAAEEERQRAAELAEAVRRLRQSLPPEPRASDAGVVTLKITLFSGQSVQRRFHRTDTFQVVYDYVRCHESYDGSDFTITMFPMRHLAPDATLDDLYPRAAVIAQRMVREEV